jgi:predicted TIM-barrel fold metal-dependent hydrolase
MRPVITPLVAALLGACILAIAPPAMAQSQTPPQAPQAAPSSDISDQKLDAAAAAIQQVAKVRQDYQQKIAAAADADKPRLKSEGTAALEKAVTDHGLSIDEYNSIVTDAKNDPTVRAKLMQRLDVQ